MKLHLGCGTNLFKGWINIDVLQGADIICDLSQGKLQFGTNSADYIYSEHFIEHITKEQGLTLFSECLRVLKPGGVLRISTPDLIVICQDYLNKKLDRRKHLGFSPQTPCDLMNYSLKWWGHTYTYDFEEIYRCLSSAGFVNIIRVQCSESTIDEFRGIETRLGCDDLVIEATKR
jgi:predicted SAM-dependent methyltransferase